MSRLTIAPAEGIWSVRAGGAVLVESERALALDETGRDTVIYFPREDVATAFLERAARVSTCPHKGEAAHFDIVTKSTVLRNAAWSYEAPLAGAEAIAGHFAFYPSDAVTIEQI